MCLFPHPHLVQRLYLNDIGCVIVHLYDPEYYECHINIALILMVFSYFHVTPSHAPPPPPGLVGVYLKGIDTIAICFSDSGNYGVYTHIYRF